MQGFPIPKWDDNVVDIDEIKNNIPDIQNLNP